MGYPPPPICKRTFQRICANPKRGLNRSGGSGPSHSPRGDATVKTPSNPCCISWVHFCCGFTYQTSNINQESEWLFRLQTILRQTGMYLKHVKRHISTSVPCATFDHLSPLMQLRQWRQLDYLITAILSSLAILFPKTLPASAPPACSEYPCTRYDPKVSL